MPEKSAAKRLFICDPVCALPFGHNVPAMRNFQKFLGPFFSEVILLGCKDLPMDIADENMIVGRFEYCYDDVMPLSIDRLDAFPATHHEKTKAAHQDLVAIIADYAIGGDDVICYPSVDFYALLALAENADRLVACGSPTIMLRLIGVMENAGAQIFAHHEAVVIALIQRLRDVGLSLKIAAETPRYAEYLATSLDCEVSVAANIETREQVPIQVKDRFDVICPGSARYDKGFLQLLDVFTQVRLRDPELKIRMTTQILPDRDLKHQLSYLTKLYAIPGVSLLPSKVSARQMMTMYDDADLVLLPYASDVYAQRGSAVFIEAICVGRPVIAYDGCAFVDQIRYFGGGEICQSAEEMAALIIEQSKVSPKIRYAKARQARDRFMRDLVASYRDWVL